MKAMLGNARNALQVLTNPVFAQAFILTFLGEWGDRSQITTIAMAGAHVSERRKLHLDGIANKCTERPSHSIWDYFGTWTLHSWSRCRWQIPLHQDFRQAQ